MLHIRKQLTRHVGIQSSLLQQPHHLIRSTRIIQMRSLSTTPLSPLSSLPSSFFSTSIRSTTKISPHDRHAFVAHNKNMPLFVQRQRQQQETMGMMKQQQQYTTATPTSTTEAAARETTRSGSVSTDTPHMGGVSPSSTLLFKLFRMVKSVLKFLFKAILYLILLYYLLFVLCVQLFRYLDGPSGSISLRFPSLGVAVDALEGFHRVTRCILTVCLIGFQYFLVWSSYSPVNLYYRWMHPEQLNDTDLYKKRKDSVHQYGADKLLNLFRVQKGIYIKVGQQIASMAGFIPEQYIDTLKVMRDQAPTIGIEEVRRVIMEDLGQPIEELFATFEEKPIASASLAQVHRATLKDGTLVAVKIQYPYIQTFFDADITARDVSSRLATRMYHMQENPEDIKELLELNESFELEMKSALRKELNFLLEASNAKRAKHNFAQTRKEGVYIPEVLDQMTSERVLTMEFIDQACNSTDKKMIEEMGFTAKQIGHMIIDAFAEQTFIHGLLHGDPHPANVLVRRDPKQPTKPQIVILDHGMYKELSDEFRQKYAKFWVSLVLKDEAGMKEYCDSLGIRDFKLYSSMIMMQGYDDLIPSSDIGMTEKMPGRSNAIAQERKVTMEEMEKFSQAMMDKKEDFMNIYRNLPTEMIIIMRSDNLLRSLNQELGQGTSVVNRFAIMARAASKGAYIKNGMNQQSGTNWRDRFALWRGQVRFELRLAIIRFQSWLAMMYIKIFGMPKLENILSAVPTATTPVQDPDLNRELELVESAKHRE